MSNMKILNYIPLISFALTSIILISILIIYKYAPFGFNTFATADAIIQFVGFIKLIILVYQMEK